MYGLNILRGELLLDREYPTWLNAIDTDRLSLGSTRSCVLAQIENDALGGDVDHYGLFSAALERFGLWDNDSDEEGASDGLDSPSRLGFDAHDPSPIWQERHPDDSVSSSSYIRLTDEWLTALADRREPANPDAVAYAYDAAVHHADCILHKLGALTAEENAARKFSVEHALTLLALDMGVDRSDYPDTERFPVPVRDAELVNEDGTPQACDTCLKAIES